MILSGQFHGQLRNLPSAIHAIQPHDPEAPRIALGSAVVQRDATQTAAGDTKVMSAAAVESGRSGRRLHPLAIRIMHWTNAIVMLVMIASGWGIYNDDVIIRGLLFSQSLRLGEWAAWSLNWHFAGMWLLTINGLFYLGYGVVTGRLRERLLPIRVSDLIHTVRDTLHFKIGHEDITVYNAVQKLLYIVVILAGISQVVTGLAIWKPVQFSGLVALLGGFQSARVLHFLGMAVIVGFTIVHVLLALLVPRTLWAMLAGGPLVGPSGHSEPMARP
jgi:thiosulfate reductase cytochrome b subunit